MRSVGESCGRSGTRKDGNHPRAPHARPDHARSFPCTSPVGSFPTGASPYGALDMAGNVFHWCEDWWDDAGSPRSARGDFTPPQDGSWRVDRGSSWGNPGVCGEGPDAVLGVAAVELDGEQSVRPLGLRIRRRRVVPGREVEVGPADLAEPGGARGHVDDARGRRGAARA
ncbi:formylglycine-generating enzyme family protein [Cellulomonas sp. P24]|uniref:formylglycine-generating enzyme family protein n=1 Tax=Cellulomonas sp. P24 TaxID=2885206 RepID=UPI00216B30A1|nr:formylglycine-generating enzyme family protein [Cellulomonas sp. P24]MCR6493573.1 formylglycine-generating enzyme family protein [Cellulomonas sp. P24]